MVRITLQFDPHPVLCHAFLCRTPFLPVSRRSMLFTSPGISPPPTMWLNPSWRPNCWNGYELPHTKLLPVFSSWFIQFLSLSFNSPPVAPQVFVHGEELDGYFKEFDASILPSDFDGKAPVADCQAIATQLFGSEDTALWRNIPIYSYLEKELCGICWS